MSQVLDTRPPSRLHNKPPATAPKTLSLGGDNPFVTILSARVQMTALPTLNFAARPPEARTAERAREQSITQNTDRWAAPVENRRTSARDDRKDASKTDSTAERSDRRSEDDRTSAPKAALSEQSPATQETTVDKTTQSKATDQNNLREQFARLSAQMTDKGPVEKTPKVQQANQLHPTTQQNGTGAMRVDVQQVTTGLVDHNLKQQPGVADAKATNPNNGGKPIQQGQAARLGTGQQSGQSNTGQNTGNRNTGGQNAAAMSASAMNTQATTPTGASKILHATAQGGATQQISGQPANFAQTLSRITASPTGASAPQKPTPRVTVSDQVSVQIKKGITAGLDKITIKLNPLELGRVDIKMETNDQGLTRALIVVERPETLDLLQRDARGLEKALQESGLKTDSGSLSFSLHQDKQHSASHDQNGDQSGQPSQQDRQDQTDSDTPEQQIARGPRHDGDLDISI